MINKIYNFFKNNTLVFMLAFAVVALPGAGIAQTTDDTNTSAEADAEAEAELSTSNEGAIETIEIVVGVSESFSLEGLEGEDNAEARNFTWTQVDGPRKIDMSAEDLSSLALSESGTYEFELIVREDGEERVDKRVYTFVSATNTSGEVDTLDPDDDDDSVPAEPESTGGKEIDKASPKLYQGISVSGRLCTQTEDCDDGDGAVSPESSQQLRVNISGNEVRGWSEEQKAQVRERLQSAGEATSANDFSIEVAIAALDNDNISEISSDDERTEIHYDTTIKLFGFIPINSKAVARAEAGGEASVDYPWYAFLATKPDRSAMISLATDIRTSHDVMISVEEEGAPVNYREEEEDSSE